MDQLPADEVRFDVAHGGRLAEARAEFSDAPAPFVDLSTGLNPVPYPAPKLPEDSWSRLPELEEIAALEAQAAQTYGAGPGTQAVALPGTQALISLLPLLFPQASVAILSPSYGEYAASFARAGTKIAAAHGLDDLRRAQAAILCNPNNPDGRRFAAEDILAAVAPGKLLLADEAFADLEASGLSLAPHLPRPGVIVLRSLSKTYGLGGLRLGFALSGKDEAERIRTALGPWRISGAAIAVGRAALADTVWREAARDRLARDTARLDALLIKAGHRVRGGTLLFRLVETGDARALYERLGRAGLLTRSFTHSPHWLRFGLPAEGDAWRRLEAALNQGMQG
jgi:cobalamin biosynthesis protein CobC